MKFEELESPSRSRDGVVCISDRCIVPSEDSFDVIGEKCSECPCGFSPEKISKDNLNAINRVRLSHGMRKLEQL